MMPLPQFRTLIALTGILMPTLLFLAGGSCHIAAEDLQYKTITNVPYRSGPGTTEDMQTNCRLDLYYPENTKDYPTVVWFHGGGLTEGKRGIPEKLKQQGNAVVSVDYRLSPQVKSPAYVEDAAAAVAWVFKNIGTYGGSDKRIYVSGASAGGYLTLMIGLDKRYLAVHGIDANLIAGLLPLTPQTITHFTVRKERGISEKKPIIDEMAPLYYVRADAPPIALVTGDRDLELLGRYEENAYFWRMMKIAGHKHISIEEIKGSDHGGVEKPGCDILLRSLWGINGAIPSTNASTTSPQNQH